MAGKTNRVSRVAVTTPPMPWLAATAVDVAKLAVLPRPRPRRRAPTAADPGTAWSGRLVLLPGVLLYAGRGGPAASHAHHAVQLVWALDGKVALTLPSGTVSVPGVAWTGDHTFVQATGLARDLGTFDDPDAFYRAHGTNLGPVLGWLYRRFVRHAMNRKVARIRAGHFAVTLGDACGPGCCRPSAAVA